MLEKNTLDEKVLIESARLAKSKAYAPYSKFRVGAALLGKDGRIYTGCNVENVSFGLTNCAERTAVFKAVSEGCLEYQAIAVATDQAEPVSPCGACRQVLAEFASQMPVFLAGEGGTVVRTTVAELLPGAFSKLDLNGKGQAEGEETE